MELNVHSKRVVNGVNNSLNLLKTFPPLLTALNPHGTLLLPSLGSMPVSCLLSVPVVVPPMAPPTPVTPQGLATAPWWTICAVL